MELIYTWRLIKIVCEFVGILTVYMELIYT